MKKLEKKQKNFEDASASDSKIKSLALKRVDFMSGCKLQPKPIVICTDLCWNALRAM